MQEVPGPSDSRGGLGRLPEGGDAALLSTTCARHLRRGCLVTRWREGSCGPGGLRDNKAYREPRSSAGRQGRPEPADGLRSGRCRETRGKGRRGGQPGTLRPWGERRGLSSSWGVGQGLPAAKTTWCWPDSREAWAQGHGLPGPGREAPPRVCACSSARPVCGVSRPVDPLVLLSWSRVRLLSPLWAAVRARQGTVSVWKPRLRRGLVQCVAVL